MKLTILQENLLFGLGIASRITATKVQLPILNNVLLTTESGRLKVSATNLEIGVNLWLGAKIEKPGKITIPAKIFLELVNLLPKSQIELEVKGEKLMVSCAGQHSVILGINAAEFPQVLSLKGNKKPIFKTDLVKEDLNRIIEQVVFAASLDEGRPTLTGVLLNQSGKNWSAVATDGYRLSLATVKNKTEVKPGKWLVPARALLEVGRLMGGKQEEGVVMAVSSEGGQIIWGTGEVELVSKLIEGQFPDFNKVIPQEEKTKLELDKQALTSAVKTAAIFARDGANIVRFKVLKTTLEVSANAPELGESLTRLEAEVTGEQGEIAFNSRYLLDFLSAAKQERVEFSFSGPLEPGLFREKGGSNWLHVIMPVRVQE
ncbi:DNA polymerase III subunit beta [Patescibacteria group bacterium]|nr:DNA polymerase III subunit beta [Patescibacteria group bacterium]MBU1931828.1 DNA polymerase III subunit beta [Patescibacteria group bacterium]